MTCPTCGEAAPEGGRFCSNCGHELAGRDDEQRRVVTVVFADLVGFTSMSEGSDPEHVKRVVDGCFESLVAIVEEFGGRVDKIIGDAILALFGAPVGHEDDAERAVRAALRMQESLSQQAKAADLRLRIGVNTGEVLVGALRSGGDYTAMGDVVNTAQRLQSAAEPGQVLVGASTQLAAGDRISYEALGPVRVRGREEPVDAWRVIDTLQPPGRRNRRVDGPLVGRHSETAILQSELDLAVSRRRAQVVLLVGDAGVGKSRLTRELVEYASRNHGAWVLEGHCVPYGEANVWWPVAEALRSATALPAGASETVARDAVLELTARLRASTIDDPDVTRITDGVLELLGYDSGLRDIDAGRARDEAMRAVVELTEAAAAERPVVVVLSDLHWADQVVLDLIDALAERVGRHPYLIIGTARHSIHERWTPPAGRHNSTVMHIEPLDRDSAEALLTQLLCHEAAPAVREDLLDRSGGNPFFLEELVTLLDETGSADDVHVADTAAPEIAELSGLPDSLRGLVVARLDALTTAERAVVEDAAVLGRTGPIEALEIMGRVSRMVEDVRPAVSGLVDKEVLEVDDAEWRFRSDLVRDVAYGTMTKVRRAESHAGIATWYEHHLGGPETLDSVVDRMAHHYGTAAALVADMGVVDGVPGDVGQRALRWLGEAACRALESEHHLVGARLFGQALDILGSDPAPERWSALLGRSRCRTQIREIEGALRDARTVLAEAESADDPVMIGRALTARGDAEQKAGDLAVAKVTLTTAIDRLGAAGADRERGEALRILGMAELFADEYEPAEESIRAALDVATSVGDRQGEAWALQNLAWLAFETGRAHEAEAWIEQSIDAFTEIGDTGGLGWALGLSAWVKLHLGERDAAAALATRILPETEARGDRWAEAMLRMLLASVHLWSGRAARSLDDAERAESLFGRAGDEGGVTQARITRARALLMRGRLDEAREVIDSVASTHGDRVGVDGDRTAVIGLVLGSVAIGDSVRSRSLVTAIDPTRVDPDAIGGADLLAGLALAHLQAGDIVSATAVVERIDVDRDDHLPGLASALSLALVALGRSDQARRHADAALGAAVATFADRMTASLALALVAARAGDSAECFRRLADARTQVEATDDVLDLAVVALAEAETRGVLGQDAPEARSEAGARWRAIGADPEGWRTVFALALDPAPAH